MTLRGTLGPLVRRKSLHGPGVAGGEPDDGLPAPVLALSLRQLSSAYSGPCVRLRRASDSVEQDFGFSGGNVDLASILVFLLGTSGFVRTWYDQSGNGNDAAQAVAGNQPPFSLTDAGLAGRPSLTYGDASNRVLTVASTGTVNGIFTSANGGYFSGVMNYTAGGVQAGRIFCKAASIVELFTTGASNTLKVAQAASVSPGSWITSPVLASGGHVFEVAYSSAALANDPTIKVDGTTQGLGTDTNPTGTISSDTGTLSIGNLVAANRGANGNLAELIFWKDLIPTAGQLTTLRANQKAYWGTA